MSAPRLVRDLMTQEIRTVGRNDALRIVDDLMQAERIRHLLVLDDEGELVGLLSQRDLFRSALARVLGYGRHAQDKLLEQLVVKEVMTNDPFTIAPDAPLAEAAAQMLAHKVGCLPVVVDGRPVGVLTESDFVKAWSAEAGD